MGPSKEVLESPNDDSCGDHEERWPSLEPRGYRTSCPFILPMHPFAVLSPEVASSFSRLPYECSWDLAALYLCRQMRSSRRSHSEFASENFGEFSQNSMSWKMARENCPVNGSSPSGYGSVYRPSGRHHNQRLALIRPSRPVSTTRESSCTFTAVSLPPDLPCAVTQSDSFWTFGPTGAYYLFSPATHRSITIPLSKFTDARIFGTHSISARWFRYGTHPC